MGTMSKHAGPGGHLKSGCVKPPRPNRRSTTTRKLTGQRLMDVLCVCADPRRYNQLTRRVALSVLRRHAKAINKSVQDAVGMFKGQALQNDSPAAVQARFLNFRGTLGSKGPGLLVRSSHVAGAAEARAKGWAWKGDGVPSKMRPAKIRKRTR